MANPYRELFNATGTFAFSAAGLIARLPIAMISLATVTTISASHGSFALASLVATTIIAASALIAPQLSRLADVYGQVRITIPASIVAGLALVALIIAAHFRFPNWTLFVSAFFVGAMPSFGAFTRARWSVIYSGTPHLRSAFALESLIDEMIFMVGPIIVTQLSSHFFPEAGLIAAVLLLGSGAVWFCTLKRTQPPIIISNTTHGRSAIFDRPVQILALALLALGGIFGAIEVATVAYTKALNIPGAAFFPLTAYAVGSFITGISYGTMHPKMPLTRQLFIMAGFVAITTLPFFFVANLWLLVLMSFVAGAACSPTIIICMGLIENLIDKEKLTEGMTWAVTGMSIGAATGISLAGFAVDYYGPQNAFKLTVVFGVFSFLVVLLFRKGLTRKTKLSNVE